MTKPDDLARFEEYLERIGPDLLRKIAFVWWSDLTTGRQFTWTNPEQP